MCESDHPARWAKFAGITPRVRASWSRSSRPEDRQSREGQESEAMVERDEQKTLESMTAADVMTAAPLTCSTFSTVLEAVMIFRDADCGAVPILEEGRPVAILTDRDVALALPDSPDLINRPVSEIMKEGIVAVVPEDSLGHICEVLRREAVRRVLVVDAAGRLLGIIGWADIAPVLSDRMMGRLVTGNVVAP
jgi:CBS domain-containing protein